MDMYIARLCTLNSKPIIVVHTYCSFIQIYLSTEGHIYVSVCDKKAVFGDPESFEQFVTRFGWVKMPCAPGTNFDTKDCECTVRAKFTAAQKPGKCINSYSLCIVQ